MEHKTLTEAVMMMEKPKTFTEWFNNLSLKDKLKLYYYHTDQELELIDNIFVGDPPPTDIGTIPFDPTGGWYGLTC